MFTIDEFHDLLRLLREHPDWRDELRRQVLADEMLNLPKAMQTLAEDMVQLTERVDLLTKNMVQLTERVDQLTAQVVQLTERVDQLTAQVVQLTERVDQLTAQVVQLTERVDQLAESHVKVSQDVDWLKGSMLELRYKNRAPAYFSKIIRRTHVLSHDEMNDLIDEAESAERISAEDANDLLEADLVVRGRRRVDGRDVFLVVEVSWGIGVSDVTRAVRRARVLGRTGRTVLPVVAGSWVTPDALAPALDMGVWQVTNGHTVTPAAAA